MTPSHDPRIEQAIEQIIRQVDDVLGDCGIEEMKPELRQILSTLVLEAEKRGAQEALRLSDAPHGSSESAVPAAGHPMTEKIEQAIDQIKAHFLDEDDVWRADDELVVRSMLSMLVLEAHLEGRRSALREILELAHAWKQRAEADDSDMRYACSLELAGFVAQRIENTGI